MARITAVINENLSAGAGIRRARREKTEPDPAARRPRGDKVGLGEHSETDRHLRRAHALLARLRRAVDASEAAE